MNISNLRDTYPELITFMEEKGYSQKYIEQLRLQINLILSNVELNSLGKYSDVYHYYEERISSKSRLQSRLTLLGIIERFDMRGEFPDGRTRQKVKSTGRYQFLSQEFKHVIDEYRQYEEQRGTKRASTIYMESSNGASFFYDLQCAGISKPEDITQKDVIAVFLNDDGTLHRSFSNKQTITAVLKANIQTNPELFNRLIAYLPELRERRKNIQYLTDEEVVKIRRVLTEPESVLSRRDKAIGMLALNYGLRGCDIANLKIDDVDLDDDLISLCQQKTMVPLALPLTAPVGNALYNYVTDERPESDCEFVFLSENRPFGRLAGRGFYSIALKIMKTAGIRQKVGDRKGFHIFRHRLATDLLGKGVAQPVISRIAGHTSTNSLEDYLATDFVHLKECALSIEPYPVRKGVFVNA